MAASWPVAADTGSKWEEQHAVRERSGHHPIGGLWLRGLMFAIESPLGKRLSERQVANSCSCLTYFCHHPLFLADSTGTHSLYTTYKDYEVMFHVSTMLPHMPNNRQQVGPPSSSQIPGQPANGLHVVTNCKESLVAGEGVFLNGINNLWLFYHLDVFVL